MHLSHKRSQRTYQLNKRKGNKSTATHTHKVEGKIHRHLHPPAHHNDDNRHIFHSIVLLAPLVLCEVNDRLDSSIFFTTLTAILTFG